MVTDDHLTSAKHAEGFLYAIGVAALVLGILLWTGILHVHGQCWGVAAR